MSSPTVTVGGKQKASADFAHPETDGVTTLCNKPGLLRFTFLLPHDVVPKAMDVTTLDGQITVRLLV